MMPEPMTITMDLHQQILAAARDTAMQEAAVLCDIEMAGYMDHSLPQCAQGAIECRKSILALRATPAPVSPAVRIAELEAAQAHNQELIAGIFAGQVREQHLEARIAELTEALALADATLSGANMDRAAVQQKVRAALSTQENTDAG